MKIRPWPLFGCQSIFCPLPVFSISLLLWLGTLCPVSLHAQPRDSAPDNQFASALGFFQSNVFAAAAAGFEDFRAKYPEHPHFSDALYYEAESRLVLGQEERAIELFEEFDSLFPFHPFSFQARLALGSHFFETGSYARAIETLQSVLDKNPTDEQAAKALYWMGESSVRLGRDDEALDYFQRISDNYRNTDTAPRAAYAIAFNQIRLKRYEDAARSFEELTTRYPDSPLAGDVGLALAEVYYEIDDYRRAVNEIIRRLPNLTGDMKDRAVFLLAESYNQLRDSKNAILNYRRFTEGTPENPYYRRSVYGLAWNYHHEGSWEWASEQFRIVAESGTDDLAAESMYYEAVNLEQAEKLDEAEATYRAFTERWPDHELADNGWFELGVLLYDQRQWRNAGDAFSSLIDTYEQSPLLGEALKYRGNTAIAVGDFDTAFDMFDRAIELDAAPESLRDEITFQRAWLSYRNRDYEASAPEFMRLFNEGASGDNTDEALFWAAESYFQQDDFSRSSSLFQRYLREYPSARHVDAAHYALGWSYFRQAAYERAVPEFEKFLSSYRDNSEVVPYRSDAQLRLADSYFALKRYAEAVRMYGRMADDGDDYALYQIGQAYSNAGDAFAAISTFNRLLADYPASEWKEESQYSLGYLYFLNQDYEAAVDAYTDLIERYPLDPLAAKAQYGIGDAYFNAGDQNNAVRAYSRVLEEYPDSPFTADAAAGIQFALLANGDDDRALALIDSFATANPDSPIVDQLRFRHAEVLYQSGDSARALDEFQTFTEQASNEDLLPDAYYLMGVIHADNGTDQDAIDNLSIVTTRFATSSRFVDAAGTLGHLLLRREKWEEAEALFSRMEQAAPDDASVLARARYGRSLALSATGRTEEAEALLREVIDAAPDTEESTPAYLGLARLQFERGNLAEASRLFELVATRSRDETGAESLYRLGRMALDGGNPASAIETLGRMATLFSGYPDWMARAYLAQGEAFENLGQSGQAVQMYENVIENYSDLPESETARKRLAVLK